MDDLSCWYAASCIFSADSRNGLRRSEWRNSFCVCLSYIEKGHTCANEVAVDRTRSPWLTGDVTTVVFITLCREHTRRLSSSHIFTLDAFMSRSGLNTPCVCDKRGLRRVCASHTKYES